MGFRSAFSAPLRFKFLHRPAARLSRFPARASLRRMLRTTCLIGLAIALSGCPEPGGPIESDPTSGMEDDTPGRALPELRRAGQIVPGEYLFRDASLGDGLVRARLERVGPEGFAVRAGGGRPEQTLDRETGWPIVCLTEPVEIREGDLRLALEPGQPVFVIAASADAVRVGVQPRREQSAVIWREHTSLDGCVTEAADADDAFVGSVGEGDAVCLFADQESLDGWAGVAVPARAATRVIEEEDPWALVEVRAPAGTVRGWMQLDLVERGDAGGAPVWTDAGHQAGRCVFPGRADGDVGQVARELEPEARPVPTIPPHEIERVVRENQQQVYECYEQRRRENPELSLRLEVVIVVDADGRVHDVGLPAGGRIDPDLTRCVVDSIMRWRFPAPRSGSVQVSRAWELRPPDAPPPE